MSVYYKIHRLSARLLIGYARQENDGRYSFSLSAAATKKCILQGTEAQEDNALFYQIMRQLNLDTAFDDHTICADLEDVLFFMDFSLFVFLVNPPRHPPQGNEKPLRRNAGRACPP